MSERLYPMGLGLFTNGNSLPERYVFSHRKARSTRWMILVGPLVARLESRIGSMSWLGLEQP